jgi:predicted NAD/FAD-dependent oxidoreductase
VLTSEGDVEKTFDALVLTPPAPQTATLLDTVRTQDESDGLNTVWQAVRDVQYASQFAYIFAYDHRIDRPNNLYGLRSADDQHPLAWIGFEDAKPGHVREGKSVVVVHTSPAWTAERIDARPSSFTTEVQAWMSDLLELDVQEPEWVDTQRWRYSVPEGEVAAAGRAAGRDAGLFLAGDAVEGRGEVGAALDSGLAAADRLRQRGE